MANAPSKAVAAYKPAGILISSTSELVDFATILYKAGPPKGFSKPEAIAVAIAFGMELGLRPATAVSLIKVVNGKPSADGEAALGLLMSSTLVDSIDHGVEGVGDERHGWITTKRKGSTVIRKTTFSVADAKKAELWNKDGPWKTYPDRMLRWRAIGHHAKDWWADVMCGLVILDDAEPAEIISVTVVPPPAAGQTAAAATTLAAVQTSAPAQTAPAPQALAAPSANGTATAAAPINEGQKHKFVQNRTKFLKLRGVTDEAKFGEAWREFLKPWGVESVLAMTEKQADEALAQIYEVVHTPEERALFDRSLASQIAASGQG